MAIVQFKEELILGLVLLITFAFTYRSIYIGSKSEFAYTLLYFTLGYSIYFVAHSFFNKSESTDDSSNWQFYMIITSYYILLSLQAWIFAIKYLESAILC